ncbi:hypothetical protein Tco_0869170 [Tanacetum coccineum]
MARILYTTTSRVSWDRSVNRVHVLDFAGLTEGMRQTLGDRLSMVYTRDEGQELFTSHAWRRLFQIRAPLLEGARPRMTWIQFILALGLHTEEEMAEAGDFLGHAPSYVFIRDPVRRLCHRMIACSISGRGQAPEKVTGVDLFYLCSMDRGTANVPYLLAQYIFRHAEGRKSGGRMSGCHFIGRLVAHFRLVSDQGLRGLSVVACELPLIDLHELERLNICLRVGDTWAWVAPGPERQTDATIGAPKAAEDAPAANKGVQADLAPVQAPQLPSPVPRTIQRRVSELEEEVQELRWSIVGLRGDVVRSITDQSRFATWMVSCMTRLMDASGRTYQAFDSTLVGSSQLPYQKRTRCRTDDGSTSAPQQPDP